MLGQSQFKVLRGMLSNNELLIWDAALSDHDHPEFGDGERIALTGDMVLYYPAADDQEDDYEEVIAQQEAELRKNRHLRIIFANDVYPASYYDYPNLHIG